LSKKELAAWGVVAILAASLIAIFFYKAPIIKTPTVNVQPTTLNLIRPTYITGLDQVSTNLYNSDSAIANFTASVYEFVPGETYTYQELDSRLDFSASVPAGQVKSVDLSFNWAVPNDTATVVIRVEGVQSDWILLQNLTLTSVYCGGQKLTSDTNFTNWQPAPVDYIHAHDADVSAAAQPSRTGCHIAFIILWELPPNDTLDHQLNCEASLVYQENGTERSVNVPIDVGLFINRNNDFSTAKEIGMGLYNPSPFRVIQGGESDYYEFQVEAGKTYNITLNQIESDNIYLGAMFNLYAFNQDQQLLNESIFRAYGGGYTTPPLTQTFIGPMNYTGYAYLQVECQSGNCPYSLEVYPLTASALG
jgi:hypothetical protein